MSQSAPFSIGRRRKPKEESVNLAYEIYNRVFRKVPQRMNGSTVHDDAGD